MLEVKGISKTYRSGVFGTQHKSVLNNIDFEIGQGEIVGITGFSGCGKSTLGKIVAGSIFPDSGSIVAEGIDVTRHRTNLFRSEKRPVNIIFQNPDDSLDPKYTLKSSLNQAIMFRKRISKNYVEDLNELFEKLYLPFDVLDRYPGQISGGEIQRVALARVFVLDPKYIVLDEPTSMLDVSVQAQILCSVESICRANKIGVMLISHDLHVLEAVCDRILVLDDGQIVDTVSRNNGWKYDDASPYGMLMKQML